MKIYREGREIYEIKDYKQVGKFMEVATIEATIKSALPIDIKVGDYVIFDYNNLKYTLYDVYPAKKQARSSTYGEAFVYDLKFKADTEQLSICPFLDLVPNDNNLSYSSLPSFSTFENVYGIADRLQANLDYLYPNQWRFDVVETTDAELLETLSDAREFAISGESCLEGLRKIYDIWGVGFIHSVEDGVNVITIGKSAGKTSMFRYGKGRGLRTIKKNLQNSDQLCTRAYVFGSTRNIPARWYNNKGYIGEAQFAPNLMIPPSKWADGIPQGAYIDAVFDGVNRIEKYGLKIKTLSYDGSDSKKDEIYPSVEKMTAKIIRDAKAEIGENTYIPSPTLYPDNERMDMVLEGSNIADDGTNSEPGYVLHSDKIIKSIEEESETIIIAEKKGESKYELDRSIQRNINICTFDIEKPASYRIRERLDFVTFKKNDLESTISAILTLQTPSGEYIELRKLAFTDKLEDFLQIPDSTHELKDAGKYTLMLKLGVSWTTDWVVPQIGEDVYLTYNIAETDITLSRGEKILDNFFTIKIKQIGFDINDYTASSGAFKNIHFRSGMCSGMSFNIAKCSYIEESDAWELKCKRVEDSSISQRFPNSIFNIAKDDRFVLLDINMPDLYVYTAMQRLYDTALEDLKHFSTPQYVIEPQIDNIQMARSPQVLKEGMYMAIDDLDIAILNEEALIDSVTITNRGTDLRSFEVTLRNDKVYNRYNKLADRIADLESTAQKTASNSTITPVQDTSESKIETPAVGFDENALADYLEGNKYTTEGDVTNLLSPIDKEVSTLRTDFDNLNTLLNGNVGGVIDTWNEVVSFLDGYSQSDDLAAILSGMNTDIANRVLIEDFEKLEEAVNPLFGYFDANGNVNNALKLDGHSAEYFATADALNTHITAFNNYKTTTDERLVNLEALWYMDKDGNVHTTHNIVVDKGGAFGKGSGGGGDVPSGGGIDEAQLWNILGTSGTQTIHSSHIPDLSGKYLSVTGGTINGAGDYIYSPLWVNSGVASMVGIDMLAKGITKAHIGWDSSVGVRLHNSNGKNGLSIKDDGTPTYYTNDGSTLNTLIHSGNIGSQSANSLHHRDANMGDYYFKPHTYGYILEGQYPTLVLKNNNEYNSQIEFADKDDNARWSLAYRGLNNADNDFYIAKIDGDVCNLVIALDYSSEYVGIGTPSPAYKLDVNDTFNATTIYQNGQTLDKYYLPLSGGTISNVNYGALRIKRNQSGKPSLILFEDVSGVLGYLGFSAKNEPTYLNADATAYHTLIHSGNIGSQSVNYASSAGNADTVGGISSSGLALYSSDLKLDGSMKRHLGYSNTRDGFPVNGGALITGTTGYAMVLHGRDGVFRFNTLENGSLTGWKVVAFTDSNVASATKLQTARTIWGQSFDGTGNVTGNVILGAKNSAIYGYSGTANYNIIDAYTDAKQLLIGYGSSQLEHDTIISGSAVIFTYGSNRTEGVRLNSTGNLLVGAVSDNGNGAKLQVNGAIDTTAEVKIGGLDVLRRRDTKFCVGEETTVYASQPTSIYGTSISFLTSSAGERMRVADNGNVLIGTTTDNGNKLQVNGGITANSIKLGSYTLEKATYGMTLSGQYVGLTLKGTNAYNTGVNFADADGVERWALSYRGVNGGANKDLYIYRTTDNGVTDTVMRLYRASGNVVIGGTADNGAKLQVTGNLTVTGGGAFGSDIRYKDIIAYQQLNLETIANAPLFTFRWTDREDKATHLGTSAQYWLDTQFKDAVNTTNKDFFHLDYGALAVGIGISVAREVKVVKTEVELLRDEVKQLKAKLNKYEQVWHN